jgi:hypothetical protein
MFQQAISMTLRQNAIKDVSKRRNDSVPGVDGIS